MSTDERMHHQLFRIATPKVRLYYGFAAAARKILHIQLFIVGYSIPRLTKANKESKYSIFGEELAILIIKGI